MNDIPAFPRPSSGVDQYAQKGMTLRDYFAAQAMQAFIDPNQWQSTVGEISSEVAFNAYAMADAMMKTREV